MKIYTWIYVDLSGEVCCYQGTKKEFDSEIPKASRSATIFRIFLNDIKRLGYYSGV